MTDKEHVLKKFIQTDRYHHRLLEKNVSKAGLHRSQHGILIFLSHSEGVLTQRNLAETFDVSGAAMANILKKLENNGLVSRASLDGDARCNAVSITEKGKNVLNKSRELASRVDEHMFDGFSSEELEAFAACLEKIQNNLTAFEEGEKK